MKLKINYKDNKNCITQICKKFYKITLYKIV